MAQKNDFPQVIFATPRIGMCYSLPENNPADEKPYISFEMFAGYIQGRKNQLYKKLIDTAEKGGKEAIILSSALVELDMFNTFVTDKISGVILSAKDD